MPSDPGAVVVCFMSFVCNSLSGVPMSIGVGTRLRADDELAVRFPMFFHPGRPPSAVPGLPPPLEGCRVRRVK